MIINTPYGANSNLPRCLYLGEVILNGLGQEYISCFVVCQLRGGLWQVVAAALGVLHVAEEGSEAANAGSEIASYSTCTCLSQIPHTPHKMLTLSV